MSVNVQLYYTSSMFVPYAVSLTPLMVSYIVDVLMLMLLS